MFTKLYLCPRYEKLIKTVNRLIRHFNACKIHIYPRNLQKIQQEYYKYKKKDALDRNWEEEDLKGGTN